MFVPYNVHFTLITYTDASERRDNPTMVTEEDAVQLDVMPADNDNKTFLVPLPQVPTETKKSYEFFVVHF